MEGGFEIDEIGGAATQRRMRVAHGLAREEAAKSTRAVPLGGARKSGRAP